MNKKSLLILMPTLFVTSSLIGCNKDPKIGNLTKEEFKNALMYILNPVEGRNYSSSGSTKLNVEGQGDLPGVNFNIKVEDFNEYSKAITQSNPSKTEENYYKYFEDSYYQYNNEKKKWAVIDNEYNAPAIKLGILFDTYNSNYAKFSFKDDIYSIENLAVKYTIEKVEVNAKVTCSLKFNSDKKLEYISEIVTAKLPWESKMCDVTLTNEETFTDYSKTKIDNFPEWKKPGDGKVSEEEWKKAIQKLYNVSENRNYTVKSEMVMYERMDTFELKVTDGLNYYVENFSQPIYEYRIDERYNAIIDNSFRVDDIIDLESDEGFIKKYIGSLLELEEEYHEYKFDEKSKSYKCVYTPASELTMTFEMRFDDDQNLINHSMNVAENIYYKYEFSDYGSTKIAFDTKEISNMLDTEYEDSKFKSEDFTYNEFITKCLYKVDFSKAKDFDVNKKVKIKFLKQNDDPASRFLKIKYFIDKNVVEADFDKDYCVTLDGSLFKDSKKIDILGIAAQDPGSEEIHLEVTYNNN